VWELVGFALLKAERTQDALAVWWALNEYILRTQKGTRIHKGTPLVMISECFYRIGFVVHAKRYTMLALCEDAIESKGRVSPDHHGVYFRLVWRHGLSDAQVQDYAQKIYDHSLEMEKKNPDLLLFPESLLQRIDDDWLTELPTPAEAASYRINTFYAQHLLKQIDEPTGKALETLAQYLMSCMPGCRTMYRKQSWSTDYDLVCALEGFDLDFRSEFGRYFVCECKAWTRPADFTTMAKFCRVLDSTKSRFGIIFSSEGISGAGKATNAEREQIKVFQDRGIVIVVLDADDLAGVANGANLIAVLRRKCPLRPTRWRLVSPLLTLRNRTSAGWPAPVLWWMVDHIREAYEEWWTTRSQVQN
jgi:hypothetical protein